MCKFRLRTFFNNCMDEMDAEFIRYVFLISVMVFLLAGKQFVSLGVFLFVLIISRIPSLLLFYPC